MKSHVFEAPDALRRILEVAHHTAAMVKPLADLGGAAAARSPPRASLLSPDRWSLETPLEWSRPASAVRTLAVGE